MEPLLIMIFLLIYLVNGYMTYRVTARTEISRVNGVIIVLAWPIVWVVRALLFFKLIIPKR